MGGCRIWRKARASMLRRDSSQASLTRRAPGKPPLLPCSGSSRLLPGFHAVGVPSSFLTTYLYSTWLPALHSWHAGKT